MIYLEYLSDPYKKDKIKENFDPERMTWIVPDIQSKLELQNYLLNRFGFSEDQSILRVSDFWQQIVKMIYVNKYHRPVKFVRIDFLKAYLKELMGEGCKINSETLLSFMNQMAPIIFHPEGTSKLKIWIKDRPSSLSRWWGWYDLSEQYMHLLLKEDLMLPQWSSSWLLSQWDLLSIWKRSLIVDLGGEIQFHEAELFLEMSRNLEEVKFLIPQLVKNISEFEYVMKPYELLIRKKKFEKSEECSLKEEDPFLGSSNIKLKIFSGVLAEVKHAASQVKKWLNEGCEQINYQEIDSIKLSEISLQAVNMEQYWPMLNEFFQKEGIPIEKELTVKMQSFPEMIQWLARLRLLQQYSFSDWEIAYYDIGTIQKSAPSFQEPNLRWEKFKSLFLEAGETYSIGQTLKGQHILNHKEKIKKNPIEFDEFLYEAIKQWPEDAQTEHLAQLLESIYAEVPLNCKMNFNRWVYFLELFLARTEVIIEKKPKKKAVRISNILSGFSPGIKKKIFLGISQQNLSSASEMTLLNGTEVWSLAQDLGFFLENPEVSAHDFALQWQLSQITNKNSSEVHSDIEIHVCFPETNFTGTLQTPHRIFLTRKGGEQFNFETPVDIPSPTRWDEIQNQHKISSQDMLTQLINLRPGRSVNPNSMNKQYEQQKESRGKMFELRPLLSISAIEKFLKCPFIFFVEKIINLQDLPIEDFVVDERIKGQLVHKLFDLILNPEKGEFDYNAAPFLKKYFNSLGKKFKKNEVKYRKEFQEANTLATEAPFKVFFQNETKTWGSFSTSKKDWIFTGKIDRIDRNSHNECVIYDYKGSYSDKSSLKNWIKKEELQLGFYAWMVDQGWVHFREKEKYEVIGALYYIYKDFEKKGGFKIESHAGTLFHPNSYNKTNFDNKNMFYEEMKSLIEKTLLRMEQWDYTPQPRKEEEDCVKCNWRGLCRAPHLN